MGVETCLWFQSDIAGALARYGEVFPGTEVLSLETVDGPTVLARWRMLGSVFRGICAPVPFRLNQAMSLSVGCADQAEVDRCWDGLLAGGGEPSQCGWLTDPWGLSWQIVPDELAVLLADPDPARAAAARDAMLGQTRIVVAELRAAADAA